MFMFVFVLWCVLNVLLSMFRYMFMFVFVIWCVLNVLWSVLGICSCLCLLYGVF